MSGPPVSLILPFVEQGREARKRLKGPEECPYNIGELKEGSTTAEIKAMIMMRKAWLYGWENP